MKQHFCCVSVIPPAVNLYIILLPFYSVSPRPSSSSVFFHRLPLYGQKSVQVGPPSQESLKKAVLFNLTPLFFAVLILAHVDHKSQEQSQKLVFFPCYILTHTSNLQSTPFRQSIPHPPWHSSPIGTQEAWASPFRNIHLPLYCQVLVLYCKISFCL